MPATSTPIASRSRSTRPCADAATGGKAFRPARDGQAGAQCLGPLLSGIASDGLAATLSGQRFGHLVGGDRFTVLDA